MNICSKLSASAEAPKELVTATLLAQTCMDFVLGTAAGAHTVSKSADPTPQKMSSSAFDALVRENKSLIERVRPSS
jgi:hypothetical protein